MPKYSSQVKSEATAETVASRLTAFLTTEGYKRTGNKKASEWRKGFYWFKFARFSCAPGVVNLEVWNFCPYPGLGSFLMYFIGINEIKALLNDMERLVAPAAAAN